MIRHLRYIYEKNLAKSVLSIFLSCEKWDLASRTVANEVLLDKAFKMYTKEVLLQRSTTFFDDVITDIREKNNKNDILANELHKRIRRNFPKKKIILKSTYYIWTVDLTVRYRVAVKVE